MASSELTKARETADTSRELDDVEKRDGTRITTSATKSNDAITLEKQKDSPLLRLPRELRDEIYHYAIGGNKIYAGHPVVKNPKVIVQAAAYNNEVCATEANWTELFNLSLTCRQLNCETSKLPYQLSVWVDTTHGSEFVDFLSQLKESKKQAIATISFGLPYLPGTKVVEAYTVPEQLASCTGLKTIISRATLDATQKRGVARFAEAHSLKLVHDGYYEEWESEEDDDSDYMHWCPFEERY